MIDFVHTVTTLAYDVPKVPKITATVMTPEIGWFLLAVVVCLVLVLIVLGAICETECRNKKTAHYQHKKDMDEANKQIEKLQALQQKTHDRCLRVSIRLDEVMKERRYVGSQLTSLGKRLLTPPDYDIPICSEDTSCDNPSTESEDQEQGEDADVSFWDNDDPVV